MLISVPQFLVSVMVDDSQIDKASGEQLLHSFDLALTAMAFSTRSAFLMLLPEVVISHTIKKKLEGYKTMTRVAQYMSLPRQVLYGMALLSDAEVSTANAVQPRSLRR